jgi:hypothetical protein
VGELHQDGEAGAITTGQADIDFVPEPFRRQESAFLDLFSIQVAIA